LQLDHHDNDDTRSDVTLLRGAKIGRYSIVEKIGSGGMGEVYLAEDSDLGRRVALKFLPSHMRNDERAKARFRREAKAAARLNHPNIVTIHEVSDYNGCPFIAMEYVEGENLSDRIEREPLNPEETSSIVIQVARGLKAAHAQGVVHRDIKPGNISICQDGLVKVLDFGLAHIVGSDSLTGSNVVIGTVGYNSPEQIRGEQIDHRTDIWSLGVIICKMLTGKLPFAGENANAIMYAITHSPSSDISDSRDDIPYPIQIAYRRCLLKNPDKRPQSMAEVLDLLGAEPSGQTIITRGRRRPISTMTLGFLGLVFIAVFVWAVRTYLPGSSSSAAGSVRRVGILPFQNQTSGEAVAAWPLIIQTLFVGNLTGVADIGVVDPLSFNALLHNRFSSFDLPRGPQLYSFIRDADIAYIIDGSIVRAGTEFTIHTTVIDPADGGVLFSCKQTGADEESLPGTIGTLSGNVLDFFQTQVLQEDFDIDLQPWLSHRMKNLEALKAFMQANEYLFNGVAGKERFLERAIKLDSGFVAPRIWLISGLVERGRREEAIFHYEELLKLESTANPFEQAMISWAGAMINGNARDRANALQMALDYSPRNNILLYELARARYNLGEWDAAVETLRPIVAAEWNYSPAYYLLGASYCMLKKYSEARQVLERSLSISPVFEYTYGILAGLASQAGNSDAAARYEELYVQTLEEKGNSPGDIYSALARNHLYMGFNTEAIRCYEIAISHHPDVPHNHSGMAQALYRIGRLQEARDKYRKALTLDVRDESACWMLGKICQDLADTAGAVMYYGMYLEYDSTSGNAEEVRRRLRELRH